MRCTKTKNGMGVKHQPQHLRTSLIYYDYEFQKFIIQYVNYLSENATKF